METTIKNSFTLFELNEHLKRVIAFNMRDSFWINCEISDVTNSKGNIYIALVERNDYKVHARAQAVIWKGALEQIKQKIGDSLWSILQVGRQVLIKVHVEYHELYGMKLNIKDIDPSVTIGQLELKRLQVLKQLESEQFTLLNAQVPVSLVWQRVAVISSPKAAGLQDFLQQLNSNPHQYKFYCEIFEAVVQGVNTPQEVISQIEKIEKRKEDFDCIVIVRGGGARLDLIGFDDYDLCVAIATCELPVLTGIGHDIDETLADLVSYQKLKTPTAVAEFLLQRSLTFETNLLQYALDIKQNVVQKLQLEESKITLLQQQMKTGIKNRFKLAHQVLESLEDKLRILDPNTLLSRGFTVVVDDDGKMLNSIDQLDKGCEYTLHLMDGKVKVKVV
ncbi:MAG: exodeoxyribonuclease VII large subunit [Saprospiraceae bacterium]|nr:exodeoxyribonuclease VII large subunit [Saprospiraceae bacterium]